MSGATDPPPPHPIALVLRGRDAHKGGACKGCARKGSPWQRLRRCQARLRTLPDHDPATRPPAAPTSLSLLAVGWQPHVCTSWPAAVAPRHGIGDRAWRLSQRHKDRVCPNILTKHPVRAHSSTAAFSMDMPKVLRADRYGIPWGHTMGRPTAPGLSPGACQTGMGLALATPASCRRAPASAMHTQRTSRLPGPSRCRGGNGRSCTSGPQGSPLV